MAETFCEATIMLGLTNNIYVKLVEFTWELIVFPRLRIMYISDMNTNC